MTKIPVDSQVWLDLPKNDPICKQSPEFCTVGLLQADGKATNLRSHVAEVGGFNLLSFSLQHVMAESSPLFEMEQSHHSMK